jgi:hypothetical protein
MNSPQIPAEVVSLALNKEPLPVGTRVELLSPPGQPGATDGVILGPDTVVSAGKNSVSDEIKNGTVPDGA